MNESPPAVLLVDDEPDMVRGLTRLLKLDNFRVDSAGTIAEMLDRSNWADYTAILIDRKLPDGLAENVVPQLKQLAPEAVVIVITGHSDLNSTIASFRAGAEDYLIKPVEPDVLRHRLRQIKELRRTRVALRHEEEQRIQSEREVRLREERLQAILKTAADAIVTIDTRGHIVDVNPATERLFGYRRDELIGQNVKVLMPSPYVEEHDAYIARYRKTGERRIIGIGREVAGRRKDGTTFPADLAVSEVDHLGLFTGIIRDISERKRLEEHILEIAADEQRRIGQELHDGTGQELTALSLFAGSLLAILKTAERSDIGGERQWNFDDTAYRKLQRMATSLSNGLAEANRHVHLLSHGIMPVQVDAEGLRSALKELADTTDALGQITCHFEWDCSVDVESNTVAMHIYRIVQEALNNAVRHSGGDIITISLACLKDQIEAAISDNGKGLDPAAKRTDPAEGGMGLRTMAYRAGLIGGVLRVERNIKGGTTVRCTIPQKSR